MSRGRGEFFTSLSESHQSLIHSHRQHPPHHPSHTHTHTYTKASVWPVRSTLTSMQSMLIRDKQGEVQTHRHILVWITIEQNRAPWVYQRRNSQTLYTAGHQHTPKEPLAPHDGTAINSTILPFRVLHIIFFKGNVFLCWCDGGCERQPGSRQWGCGPSLLQYEGCFSAVTPHHIWAASQTCPPIYQGAYHPACHSPIALSLIREGSVWPSILMRVTPAIVDISVAWEACFPTLMLWLWRHSGDLKAG